MGAAAFVGTELLLSGKPKLTLKEADKPLYLKLETAKKQNKVIINNVVNIEDEEVKKDLKDIHETVKNIIQTIESKPKKAKNINNFFEYYLPVFVSIVQKYDEIENQRLKDKDSKNFMNKAAGMIKEAKTAFNNILSGLYESDIVDADAEMKVFNSMIKADGIGANELIKEDEDE
jgi:5-bromo-4-chloroindolyl phosphate hydrolysis protein